jgi:hypothetical protein
LAQEHVELLDAGAAGMLAAIAEAGGVVPLATIEDHGWEQVVAAYGYEPDDDSERRHVVGLLTAMVSQLGAVGAVVRRDDEVALVDTDAPVTAPGVHRGDGACRSTGPSTGLVPGSFSRRGGR